MVLAGLPVPDNAIGGLAELVRAADADDLADRLERALHDDVKLRALTTDERAIILSALEDPPEGLAELRAVPNVPVSAAIINRVVRWLKDPRRIIRKPRIMAHTICRVRGH